MLNKAMIIGRLGRAPELRRTSAGVPCCTLNIATDEGYTDRDGNKVERTEWHRVQVWQKTAEACVDYLDKGSLVYVEGRLATRKWQDQNGQERSVTEIQAQRVQFLERRGAPEEGQSQQEQRQGRPASRGRNRGDEEDWGSAYASEALNLDDVPF